MGLKEKIDNRTTISRDINFVMAVLAILASAILALYFGVTSVEDGVKNMLGETMNAATCLGVLTVGIGFMVFAVPYKGTVGEGRRPCVDYIKRWCSTSNEEKEMSDLAFFYKSKSFCFAILVIICMVLAGFIGDLDGSSELTKIAIWAFGGTLLAALAVGGFLRHRHFTACKEEAEQVFREALLEEQKALGEAGGEHTDGTETKTFTFKNGDWKKYEKKNDFWTTKGLQMIVLVVALGLAIGLTIAAVDGGDFFGRGGSALATVWVLFGISAFGFGHLLLNAYQSSQTLDGQKSARGDVEMTSQSRQLDASGRDEKKERGLPVGDARRLRRRLAHLIQTE